MMTDQGKFVSSGLHPFDEVVHGLRLGDNVVWQVDTLEMYRAMAAPFAAQALQDGRSLVYVRFAPHPPLLPPLVGIETVVLDPSPGFDFFTANVQHLAAARGRQVFYIFDNLSDLLTSWGDHAQLSGFFQIVCPALFELDTVAYFGLTSGRQPDSVVARIRDTTQLLLDVFQQEGQLFVNPVKVWGRYAPQMFTPHLIDGDRWLPVLAAGTAAAVAAAARAGHPPAPGS
jgi:hypothetical protein